MGLDIIPSQYLDLVVRYVCCFKLHTITVNVTPESGRREDEYFTKVSCQHTQRFVQLCCEPASTPTARATPMAEAALRQVVRQSNLPSGRRLWYKAAGSGG